MEIIQADSLKLGDSQTLKLETLLQKAWQYYTPFCGPNLYCIGGALCIALNIANPSESKVLGTVER